VSGTVTATDVDGDSLSYAKGSDPAHGTVVVNTDGTWTYTPETLYKGSDSFTVTVSDGNGGTATATVSVGVTAVNHAPTTSDVAVSTSEDTPVSGNVTATDVDADTLSYAKGSDPAHGSVVVNPDGTWTYTPSANFNGSDSFIVAVSDGNGGTTTATVNVGVTPVNDAPVTSDVAATTQQDTAVSGSVTATDVDGDSLSYAKGSDPSHGSVVVASDGSWTYTPDTLYKGSDSFTVAISDGNGGTATSTVTVGVSAVNHAPVANDVTATTSEDTPVSGSVAATDVDGDALSYVKGSDPAHGSVVVNADGTWTYTPNANFNGTDSFIVSVSDGNGGTTTATVNVGVTPVNDVPTTGNVSAITNEDTPVSGTVVGSDVDGDVLSYAKASDPAHGSVVVNADGTWTYTPNANFHGGDSFTVTVSDGNGGSTTATVTVGVTPVNDAPTTSNVSVTTPEDTPVSGSVTAADADGDALSYAKGSDPAHGAVIVNADGTWTYTPNANFNGSDSFTVAVSDGNGGSATATVTVGVTPVNDAPVTSDVSVTTPEDTPVSGSVTATDVDGDALSFAKGSDPAHGSVVVNANGSWTYTPSTNYNGSDSFTVSVSDGHGGTATATVSVGITGANDAPVGVADAVTVVEGSNSVLGSVLSNDPADSEGSPVSVAQFASSASGTAVSANGINTVVTAQGGLVVMNGDGTYRYVAPAVTHDAANTPVNDSFVYRSTDGTDASAWTTVTIHLTDTTPTAVANSATVAFNGSVSGNLLANDTAVDAPSAVTSVTYAGSNPAQTVTINAGGSASITTSDGVLTVSSDGTYSYTSSLPEIHVLTGSSLATWRQSTHLYGFTSGTSWQNGSDLNLSALTSSAESPVVFANGSKNGIGVGTSGSATVGNGEQLIVDLLETTTHATIGIAQLNTNQNPSNAHWYAYDASGTLVGSGDFSSATSTNNGSEYTLGVSTSSAFEYVRLSWTQGNQGFVLSSLDVTRQPLNYDDSFTYTMKDADGDTSTSTLVVTPGSSTVSETTTISGTGGGDNLSGNDSANTILGAGGDDVIHGLGGNDTLTASGSGHNVLYGGNGNDTLNGASGNDILYGGSGNDSMSGGSGADVFAWTLTDAGSNGAPAVDTITDFNVASPSAGGDLLDLRDLLQGESSATLDKYLEFDTSSVPGSTVIHISSSGSFAAGASWDASHSGSENQRIVLSGVDLPSALGLAGGATDMQIINELLTRGKLLTDPGT
jgi:VCBS repeat-containing protein